MDQENMRIVWAGVVEWIVKEEDGQYFHRREGDYGMWHPGIPPGTNFSEVDHAFRQ